MPGEKHMKPEIKKKPKGLALPLILIVLLGVGSFFIQIIFNKGKKAECDYSQDLYPAEVIRLDTVSTGYCELYFTVKKEGKTDTITYSSEFGGYASFEQMTKKKVAIGEKFQYAIQKLKSGDCPTLVEGLILEKFSN